MKGFLGAVLALSLLALVFIASSAHVSSSKTLADANADAILVEKEYYRRAEIRGALEFALLGAESEAEAAAGIAEIGVLAQEEFAREGIGALVWCGLATESELESLRGEMMREGKALPCPSCWDASSLVAGTCCAGDECRPDAISPCELILLVGAEKSAIIGTAGIRMTDAGEACAYPEVATAGWKKAVIGASLYEAETGYSGVLFLPQGFEAVK